MALFVNRWPRSVDLIGPPLAFSDPTVFCLFQLAYLRICIFSLTPNEVGVPPRHKMHRGMNLKFLITGSEWYMNQLPWGSDFLDALFLWTCFILHCTVSLFLRFIYCNKYVIFMNFVLSTVIVQSFFFRMCLNRVFPLIVLYLKSADVFWGLGFQ